MCAKILINAGISELVYRDDYVDELSKRLFEETAVKVRHFRPQD
jgi:dCMP deaminase